MPGVFSGERPSTLEWWRPQVSFSNPNKIYDQQDTCSSNWSGGDILHNHLGFEQKIWESPDCRMFILEKIQVQIDKSMFFLSSYKNVWL